MALLSIDQEMDRAQVGDPFTGAEAGDGWMDIWCEECRFKVTCPLLPVALLFSRTPAAWILRDPEAVNRYTCTEYAANNTDEPTVVIDDGEAPTL